MNTLRVTRWGAEYRGRRFPCAVGRGGIFKSKREGDGVTPAGRYPVSGFRVFARADRIHMPNAQGLRLGDIWSDDPRDPAYNRYLNAVDHPFGHERLRRADPLYDLIVDIGYNRVPNVPGHGSALFLHIWRKPRHPTEGCVAFRRDHLIWLLEALRPEDELVIYP